MSDVGATAAPAHYRPDVQGLRAVAVLMVVAYHAGGYLPGGFIGVDVFFVISGFVIGQLLHRELEATGSIDFKRFYLRRIRRILPALAVLLTVVLPLSAALAPIGGLDGTQRTGFTAALFNANTYLMYWGGTGGGYFEASAESNALLHTWSLAVEEQFYMVFPFILWGAWRAFSRRGNSAVAVRNTLIVVAVISFFLSWVLVAGVANPLGVGELIAFYSAPTRAWQFAVGALLALGIGTTLHKTSTARQASAVAGLALVAFAGIFYDASTAFPGIAALAPTVGTALLIASATSTTTNPISKLLATKPMQTIGDISYSWYLWHWPIIVFAVAYNQTSPWVPPAAAAASILPTVASYRYVENPLRHSRAFTIRRTLALCAACLIIPVAGSAVLFVATPRIQDSEAAKAFERHIDVTQGCDSTEPLGGPSTNECTWEADSSVGTAVLIGDSNAGHFSEGFIAAANQLDMNAIVRTASGCAFIDVTVLRDGIEETGCRGFVTNTIAALGELEPTLIVVAMAPDRYIAPDNFQFVDDSGGIVDTADERQAVYGAALEMTLGQIRSGGVDLFIVHPAPRPLDGGIAPDASWLAYVRGFNGVRAAPRRQVQAMRAAVIEIERSAAEKTGTRTVDFFDTICTEDPCEILRGGKPVYRDVTHISVAESERLAEQWRTVLSRG